MTQTRNTSRDRMEAAHERANARTREASRLGFSQRAVPLPFRAVDR